MTKNALSLSANQYYRLALSGAICTVLVRTALNPLELVKTKIQLKNDDEIIELAMKKSLEEAESKGEVASTTKPAISTNQVIQSLAEVRGPFSLFQSADITFLTSIVFGMFGFGAVSLFFRNCIGCYVLQNQFISHFPLSHRLNCSVDHLAPSSSTRQVLAHRMNSFYWQQLDLQLY